MDSSCDSQAHLKTMSIADLMFIERCKELANNKSAISEAQMAHPLDTKADLIRKFAFIKDPELIVERMIRQNCEKKGLKPELCKRHNRMIIWNCLSCEDESKKYLCYYCTKEGQHKGHKAKVIKAAQDS